MSFQLHIPKLGEEIYINKSQELTWWGAGGVSLLTPTEISGNIENISITYRTESLTDFFPLDYLIALKGQSIRLSFLT